MTNRDEPLKLMILIIFQSLRYILVDFSLEIIHQTNLLFCFVNLFINLFSSIQNIVNEKRAIVNNIKRIEMVALIM